jgi:hypothetical protein
MNIQVGGVQNVAERGNGDNPGATKKSFAARFTVLRMVPSLYGPHASGYDAQPSTKEERVR